MKKGFLLILWCLCYHGTFGQIPSSSFENLASYNLKGKIKKVSTCSFAAKKVNGEIIKSHKGWQDSWEFDEELFFDTTGLLKLKKVYKNQTPDIAYSIKYDKNNRIVLLKKYDHLHFFTYDARNNLIASKEINELGYKLNSNTFQYNKKNQVIKEEEFDSDEKISIKLFYYDPRNRLAKIETFYEDESETETFTYDKQNRLLKYTWVSLSTGPIETTTFQYVNKLKTMEHWVDYEEGEPFGSIDYTYEKGNETTVIEKDDNGEIVVNQRNTYEYDEHGNWIKMIIDDDGEYFIVERTISYYTNEVKNNHGLIYMILTILSLGVIVLIGIRYARKRQNDVRNKK